MSGRLKYTLVVRHPDTDAPTALLVGAEVPDWASDLVHPDDVDGEPGTDGDGSKAPTNAELEAEIARRNEGRDEADLIKPGGKTKADLVAALEADDAK